MRFRLVRQGKASHSAVPEKAVPPRSDPSVPPRAADLENPYSRYYGTARKREDLRK